MEIGEHKMLKLSDINDYIVDTQLVRITAYNIKLYEGICGDIPMKFSKYELVPQKSASFDDVIVIELDC